MCWAWGECNRDNAVDEQRACGTHLWLRAARTCLDGTHKATCQLCMLYRNDASQLAQRGKCGWRAPRAAPWAPSRRCSRRGRASTRAARRRAAARCARAGRRRGGARSRPRHAEVSAGARAARRRRRRPRRATMSQRGWRGRGGRRTTTRGAGACTAQAQRGGGCRPGSRGWVRSCTRSLLTRAHASEGDKREATARARGAHASVLTATIARG
jgi:hypothetical protein